MSGLAVRWIGGPERGARPAYAVFEGETQVSGCFACQAQALANLERIQRRRASRRRPCLCCGRAFLSEGAHHRLCGACRLRDAEEPFALAERS